jgi:hypothetical protein
LRKSVNTEPAAPVLEYEDAAPESQRELAPLGSPNSVLENRLQQAGETLEPRVTSILQFAPAMVVLLIVAACGTNTADVDLWGHLRSGADFLASGHLAIHDSYSYSVNAPVWINHEYLSEAIFAWMYSHLGVVGLKIVRFGCASVMIICLAGAIGETSAGLPIQFAVLALTTLVIVPAIEFRPQIFTFAMFSAIIWMLVRDNFGRRAPLWLAIPMLLLWCNLHGGFVIGIGALGLYTAAVAGRDLIARRGPSHALHLAALTAVSALATLVNPYGLAVWHSVLRTMSRPPMMSEIVEWRSLWWAMVEIWRMPNSSFVFDIELVLMFVALVASIAIAPFGDDFPLLAVASATIASAISMFRNFPLALISSAAPLARHLSTAINRRAPASGRQDSAPRASLLTQTIIGLLAVVLAINLGIFSPAIDFMFTPPAGALGFITEHDLRGNVLAPLVWCDYVLYHRAPRNRVFIDTRYEMIYPDRIARDFEDFQHNRERAAAVLASYPHDFVMLAPDAKAVPLMNNRLDWKLVYRDDIALLYARVDSAAAHIPGVPIVRNAPPRVFP